MTYDFLAKKRIDVNNACAFCSTANQETCEHIFLNFPIISAVWCKILILAKHGLRCWGLRREVKWYNTKCRHRSGSCN